uniref:Uncharacterized protein n=1 Tax=Acrobeloides nanus TaxID=290746 RepID=A0A914CXT2_9BILA
MDGQYDSQGYSSSACCVTAVDLEINKILTYESVYKQETENVSTRMEPVEAEDEGDLELKNDADNLINQVNGLQIDDLDELIYDLNISYEDEEQAIEQ